MLAPVGVGGTESGGTKMCRCARFHGRIRKTLSIGPTRRLCSTPWENDRQYYVMPICHHADLYLGFLMIFNAETDRVHCELAWSPDTWEWHIIDPGTPLIDTSHEKGDYDWGCVYASVPIFLPDEIRIYYGASDDTHYGWRKGYLALATVRLDGLAGLQPSTPNVAGSVTTKPVVCTGKAVARQCGCGGWSGACRNSRRRGADD